MPGCWDRLNSRAIFRSGNEFGIPDLPLSVEAPERLVGYSDRRGCEGAVRGSAVHFFLDDYRFETVWSHPERSISRVSRVGCALTPDFSVWREMPAVMQMWQVYRSRWCGLWMLEHGVRVVPTVSWGGRDSFRFAFAGLARGSVVALSSVGIRDRDSGRLFAAGLEAMIGEVKPCRVLVYGRPVGALEELSEDIDVVYFDTFWRLK